MTMDLDELQPDADDNLREFIDKLVAAGYTVGDSQSADPELIDPGGRAVETWREDYPYDELMSREEYELEKYQLQVELLKFQYHGQDNGLKHLILFEGRDAAGKGGTIKRFIEHLNPRATRVVALTKPSSDELGQWYFQRYIRHFPTSGEIVLFDRSWYNRAGVERVMGFCSNDQYETFMQHAPKFERMLQESGIHITKFWFSVTRREQRTRFAIRCGAGSCRRWIWSPWTSGRPTRPPRKPCSRAPTPSTLRGPPFAATTRSAPGSTPCGPS